MRSVLFVHRSVGRNLLVDGNVYQRTAEISPSFNLSDYDQNTDVLHPSAGMPRKMGFGFPGDDTKPAAYAAVFSDDPATGPIRDFCLRHAVIVIKSCYPNSNITSDQQLEGTKTNYRSIARFFASHPDKQLIVMSSPPLRRLRTSPAAAARARQLASWLATEQMGQNVHVFNLFNLLASPESSKHPNVLDSNYCRLWPFDSHPNAKASQVVAPLFVTFVAQVAN